MKRIVILPTYNEAENLEAFISEIQSSFQTDLLVVDDSSPDGTGQIADRMAQRSSNISVLHRPGKMGLGSAYVAGFRWALEKNYDLIFEMDSDFSHDPKDLKRLAEALENCDLALGSRYVEGGRIENWPKHRLFISELGNIYARIILRSGVQDLTGGFKGFRSEVLRKIDLSRILSDGYAFQIETTYRAYQNGFKIQEVPIHFKDRTRGKSKISRNVVWEALWLVWKLRFERLISARS